MSTGVPGQFPADDEGVDGGSEVYVASHRLMLLQSSSIGMGFKVMGDADWSGSWTMDRCQVDNPV